MCGVYQVHCDVEIILQDLYKVSLYYGLQCGACKKRDFRINFIPAALLACEYKTNIYVHTRTYVHEQCTRRTRAI